MSRIDPMRRRSRAITLQNLQLAVRAATHRVVELLETRILMSTDFVYSSGSLTPLNAILENTPTNIELVDQGSSQVIQSLPLAQFSGNISITGSTVNDSLKVDVTVPVNNVLINGDGGTDSVEFSGSLTTGGGNINVSASNITVDTGVNLSTGMMTGQMSTGNSGDITFDGTTITIASGANLLAGVIGNAYGAGDIDIEANDAPSEAATVFGDLLSPVLESDRNASITVGTSTIDGGNVTLNANAQTQTRYDNPGPYYSDVASQLLSTLGQISQLGVSLVSPVSGEVQVQHATGGIVLTNTTITATGAVTVTANTSASAAFTAVGINSLVPVPSLGITSPFIASIGVAETLADSNVELDGTTNIKAENNVTVGTNITSDGEALSRGDGNASLSPAASVDFAISLAVAVTDEESTVSTSAQSRIESLNGDVTVNANGTSATLTSAQALLFQDGTAGLAVAVSVDKANITSTVNGTIIADNPQGAAYTFDASQVVNVGTNSIELSGIDPANPITRGETLIYHADNGTPIGGLTDGASYVVSDVTTNSTGPTLTQTIQLATALPLHLDASQVNPASTQTLGQLALTTFNSSAVGQDSSGDLTIDPSQMTAPLQNGDIVTYLGANSPVTENNITATFARSASGDTITRTDGGTDFVSLGLFVNQQIQISNANGTNNGVFTIKSFSPNGNTITLKQSNVLTAGTVTGFNLASTDGTTSSSITASNITATFTPLSTGDTITRTDGGSTWTALGLEAGQQIQISNAINGNGSNNGTYTIGSISSDGKTLVLQESNVLTPGSFSGFSLKSIPAAPNGIGGLVQGSQYGVYISGGKISLYNPATPTTFIPYSGAGTGIQGFSYFITKFSFDPSTAVDSTQDTIDLPNSNLQTGDVLIYNTDPTKSIQRNVSGFVASDPNTPIMIGTATMPDAPIAGLQDGYVYYVTRVDANHIRLSESSVDAMDAAAIALTSPGTGTQEFDNPALANGVEIEATFTVSNGASAGGALSDAEQPLPAVALNAPTSAEDLLAAFAQAPALGNALNDAVNTNFGKTPYYGPQPAPAPVTNTGMPIDISGTFAINVYQHNVQAIIGSTATIESGQNVTVNADIEESTSAASNSQSTRLGLASAQSVTGEPGVEVAVGFAYTLNQNTAEATIQDNAVVDASGTLSVTSTVDYPFLVSPSSVFNPAVTEQNLGLNGFGLFLDGTLGLASNLFNSYVVALGGSPASNNGSLVTVGAALDIEEYTNVSIAKIGTAAQINQNPTFRNVGQTVSVAAVTNMHTIDIGQIAAYNLSLYGLPDAIDAIKQGNVTETLKSFVNPFGISGQAAIGPSVLVTVDTNTTVAEIQSGERLNINLADIANNAIVLGGALDLRTGTQVIYDPGVGGSPISGLTPGDTYYVIANPAAPDSVQLASSEANANSGIALNISSGSATGTGQQLIARTLVYTGTGATGVSVTANQSILNVAVSQTGGRSSDFGVSASVTVGAYTSDTEAFIGNDVTVTAASVTVNANDTINRYAIEGSYVLGEAIGVGASIGVNSLDRTTLAYIGSPTGTNTPGYDPAQIVSSGPVTVDAENAGNVFAFALAGSVLTDPIYNPTPKQPLIQGAANFVVAGTTIPDGTAAVGASVAVNIGSSTVEAFVQGVTVVASNLTINANSQVNEQAVVIGGAANNASEGTNVAVGGAFAVNSLSSTVNAFLLNSNANLTNETLAANLAISATDNSTISSDGGGVSFVKAHWISDPTDVSIGVGVAVNSITSNVAAYVDNSPVVMYGIAMVVGTFRPTINAVTIAGAGAVSTGTTGTSLNLAGAGAGAYNNISGGAVAYIANTTLPGAFGISDPNFGLVEVTATDAASITADAGAVALSAALVAAGDSFVNLSVAASVAINDISVTTQAYILNSTINVGGLDEGDILINASSSASINALTLGGALGSGEFSGAGSGNTIDDTVQAFIQGGAQSEQMTPYAIVASQGLSVIAVDADSITADAGGFAIAATISQQQDKVAGSASIGVGAAVNTITTVTTADIHDVTASSPDVTVRATSQPTINALTMGGAGAASISTGDAYSFAGAGAGSGNSITSTTEASISALNSSFGSTTVFAPGEVDISATDNANITANAGAIALAFTVAKDQVNGSVGVSVASNSINSNVSAYVSNASVANPGVGAGGISITATSTDTISALTVAGAGALALGAGSSGFGLSFVGAGTGSGNSITANTTAYVAGNSQITVTGPFSGASITATNDSQITATAVAGSLSATIGTSGAGLAVGIAIANNVIDGTTAAYIDSSKVSATENIGVSAVSDSTITATTVGVAVSATIGAGDNASIAGAGAAAQSTNTITGTTEAYVTDGSIVANTNTGPGNVDISATDSSTINANSGGGSLALSAAPEGLSASLAISAGLSTNTITNSILAFVSGTGTKVQSNDNVNVDATDTATITAFAISIGGAVAISSPEEGFSLAMAGGASIATNTITNTVAAYESGGATIIGPASVRLVATDNATATATVPSIEFTISIDVGVAIGISLGTNTIDDSVEAYISGSTANSSGSTVVVQALTDSTASATATPISLSISLLGNATQGGHATSTIGGEAMAAIEGGSTVYAKGAVDVSAVSTDSATATDFGFGLGFTNVAALLSNADISAATTASIQSGATIDAGALNVLTYSPFSNEPQTTSMTAAATVNTAALAFFGGTGANAESSITGPVSASIDPGATVQITGAATIAANSNLSANSNASGGAGGAVNIAAMISNATISGDTTASIGAGATNAGAFVQAGSLNVLANSVKNTNANMLFAVVSVLAGGGGGQANATDSSSTTAQLGDLNTNIDSTGAVTVSSTSSETTTGSATGVAVGGGLAISAMSSTVNSSGNTLAFVGPSAYVNVGSLSVTANTPTRTVTANDVGASVSLLAGGAVVEASVNITGNVEAYIGDCSEVLTPTSGSITLTAIGNANAVAVNNGGSGGILGGVSVFGATTNIGSATTPVVDAAFAAGNVYIITGNLDISSTGNFNASSSLTSVGVSFVLGVGAATGTSFINGNTLAYIGASPGDPRIDASVSASGGIKVTATSDQASLVNANVGGSGVAGVGAASSNSTVSGETNAFIGTLSHITSGGAVQLLATVLGASASTTLLSATAGGIAVSSSDANATSTPTVSAYIGNGSTVSSTGDLTVLAQGRGQANSNAQAYGGSIGVTVGVAQATSTYTPTVEAQLEQGSVINAGGSITVNALLNDASSIATPPDVIQPNNGDTNAVDLTTDKVDFTYPLTNGQTVVYNVPSGTTAIGGLNNNQSYNVIVTDPGYKIRFGDLFDNSNIDLLTDTITFPYATNLVPGEAVYLDQGGLSTVAPWQESLPSSSPLYVDPSKVFYVRGVYSDPNNPQSLDPFSIRLVQSLSEATASDSSLLNSFGPSNVNSTNNTITISGNNFIAGQQVTYRAPAVSTFKTEDVNAETHNVTYTSSGGNVSGLDIVRDANGVGIDYNNNEIFVQNHGFSTGDAVTYTTTGTPIGGLVNGDTYFVIVIDSNTIELAASYYQAVGLAANPILGAAAIPVTPITLTNAGPAGTTQTLARDIQGLQDGDVYYVTNPLPNGSFQLSATRGGSPIAISDTTVAQEYNSSGGVVATNTFVTAGGTHLIGTLGIDLIDGSGTQDSVYLKLTSSTTGTRLLGPGGEPLGQLGPQPGDGTSSASATGGTGGLFVDVDAPSANMIITPTVQTLINASRITAGGNVDIEAVSQTTSWSTASSAGGGAVTVGEADANTTMNSTPTVAKLGIGVTITAGGNFTLNSESDQSVTATSSSNGGGLISAKIATATATLTGGAQSTVGVGVTITAGGLLKIHSTVNSYAHTNTDVFSIGLGAGADADNASSNLGVTVVSPATVEIMPGAVLVGNEVDIAANLASMNVSSHAHATAINPILLGVAVAYANSYVNVTAPAQVLIDENAAYGQTTITGYYGVDIQSLVGTVTSNPYDSHVVAVALIPPQAAYDSGNGTGAGTVTGTIQASAGALVVAGTRTATTPLSTVTNNTQLGNLPSADTTQLALFVNANNSDQWDADVNIIVPNPNLVVDSSGHIVSETGINATIGSGTVNAVNIIDPGPGQIVFESSNTSSSNGGVVNGSMGTFAFQESYGSVNINSSYGTLTLGNITTYAPLLGVEPKVTIDVPTVYLQFNVANIFSPTNITITNYAPSGGIELTGLIDNPIGTTNLTSAGSIYSENFASGDGIIQTNWLMLNAGTQIGGTSPGTMDRVGVNIVESAGLPAFMSVTAGTNIYLGVQGINRNPAVTSNFTTTTDPTPSLFNAGGLADILLEGGLSQTTTGNTMPFGIQVYETSKVIFPGSNPPPDTPQTGAPRTTLVTNHFRNSSGGTQTAPVNIYGIGTTAIPITYDLGLVQAGSSINIHKDPSVTVQVNINSQTNILADAQAGNVNANTNGSIYLEETLGDMRVGLIQSTDNNVEVVSDAGSILDLASNLSAPDVMGINLTLLAAFGGIGATGTTLKIDSSDPTAGVVNATALKGIYLTENYLGQANAPSNNLNVGLIESKSGDVALETQNGTILNAPGTTSASVEGNNILLIADSTNPAINSVGATGNDLMIDSSFSGAGGLFVIADGYIGITQTVNTLYVQGINEIGGGPFAFGSLTTPHIPGQQNNIVVTGGVDVSNLNFNAGDDFTDNATAPILAVNNGAIVITIDANDTQANHPVLGNTMQLAGMITAGSLMLYGGSYNDTFDISPQKLTTGNLIELHGGEPMYPTYPAPGDRLIVYPATNATNHELDITQGTGYVTFSDGSTEINYYSIEYVGLTSSAPPQVVQVYANSTAWATNFRNYIDGDFTNPNAQGYPVPDGTLQLETLPWININQLKIKFSEDVGASLTLADFGLTAAPGWLALQGVGPAGMPFDGTLPTITGFTYDPTSFIVTLQLSGNLPAAVVDLTVSSAGVTNSTGTNLDGEWVNGVTTGNSGNNIPGGDFNFLMFILPGDSVDQSNEVGTRAVNTTDSQLVRQDQNGLVYPSLGALGYDPRADLNGDAFINSTDSQSSRDEQSAIIVPTSALDATVPTLAISAGTEFIRLDSDGAHVDLFDNSTGTGAPTASVLLADVPSIISGASQSLTIDFSNGDPIPAAGLTVSGAGTLTLIGTSGNDNFTVGASTIKVDSASFNAATITYSDVTHIDINGGSGSDAITQTAQPGAGAQLTLLSPTSNDTLNVDAGQFTFPASAGSGVSPIYLGTVSIGAGAVVSLASGSDTANRAVLILGDLSIAGSAGAWTGTLDLNGNDLVLRNAGAAGLAALTNQLSSGYDADAGYWNGAGGIVSTTAAINPTYLTTLAAVLNNTDEGQPLYGAGTDSGLFEQYNPGTSDVLVKYTYYGDTNLDGKIDGSDYSRIDNGFNTHLTGWQNGDFNYDGVVDGSDYTLIDNAFNNQGAALAAQVAPMAAPAAQIATPAAKSTGKTGSAVASTSLFQSANPISLVQPSDEKVELILHRKDILDKLATFA